MTATLFEGDARVVLRDFPPDFFHCAITSPPYFGLRSYDGGVEIWDGDDGNSWRGQLGAEPTPELYIQHLIQVMRGVRRVLRPDGVFWLNIGDSWASGKGTCFNPGGGSSSLAGHARLKSESAYQLDRHNKSDLVQRGVKPLDVELVPEQLALAARADGWYVRSMLIWVKGVSLSDEYNGNPMPTSVNGWRWERHKIGVSARTRGSSEGPMPPRGHRPGQVVPHRDGSFNKSCDTVWRDCPGCPRCESTGGYVLRKGSWRPTNSYEHILMLTKTNRYYCDREAAAEQGVYPVGEERSDGDDHKSRGTGSGTAEGLRDKGWVGDGGRNLRSVLAVPTTGSKIRHFATFPPRLVEPLIRAATSEKGCCPSCGSPWARIVECGSADHDGYTTAPYATGEDADRIALLRQAARERGGEHVNQTRTIGWLPTCSCDWGHDPVPCWVLDPFCGSGTVSLVCGRLGLDSVGIDTSAKYIHFAEERIAEDARKRGA